MDIAKIIIAELLFIIGIFTISYGLWTIYPASGIIFLGSAMCIVSYQYVRARVSR